QGKCRRGEAHRQQQYHIRPLEVGEHCSDKEKDGNYGQYRGCDMPNTTRNPLEERFTTIWPKSVHEKRICPIARSDRVPLSLIQNASGQAWFQSPSPPLQ